MILPSPEVNTIIGTLTLNHFKSELGSIGLFNNQLDKNNLANLNQLKYTNGKIRQAQYGQ